MELTQVKEYWEDRASTDKSAQSTTQDYYLREIEFRVISELIEKCKPKCVMDVGCGDARTTVRLATVFKNITFVGVDYSKSMVENALENINRTGIENLEVMLCDVSQSLPSKKMEMVYSTRCLINLPTWELQQTALAKIADSLTVDGCYVMIENFIEGHDNFNHVRESFGLPEISVREHNLYFNRTKLLNFISKQFDILEEINISSTYYLVSRVIYSKICQGLGTSPDYFDYHHEYAARLPFSGEFGPVRMICLRRK